MATDVRVARRVKKVAAGFGLAAIASIGVMGFLHTEYGKPLLMKLGGCPVAKTTPVEMEQLRNQTFAAAPGSGTAKDRPSLGFELDKSTIDDVEAWAKSKGVSCEEQRAKSVLSCANVPTDALPHSDGTQSAIAELVFGFRASDHALYNVTTWRYHLSAGVASTDFQTATKNATAAIGAPTKHVGDSSAAALASGSFATAVDVYNYEGYDALISAVTLKDGVQLRIVYSSTKIIPVPSQGS